MKITTINFNSRSVRVRHVRSELGGCSLARKWTPWIQNTQMKINIIRFYFIANKGGDYNANIITQKNYIVINLITQKNYIKIKIHL
jgi:hypothetical protein